MEMFVNGDGCGIGIDDGLPEGFPHCDVDISRKPPIRHAVIKAQHLVL